MHGQERYVRGATEAIKLLAKESQNEDALIRVLDEYPTVEQMERSEKRASLALGLLEVSTNLGGTMWQGMKTKLRSILTAGGIEQVRSKYGNYLYIVENWPKDLTDRDDDADRGSVSGIRVLQRQALARETEYLEAKKPRMMLLRKIGIRSSLKSDTENLSGLEEAVSRSRKLLEQANRVFRKKWSGSMDELAHETPGIKPTAKVSGQMVQELVSLFRNDAGFPRKARLVGDMSEQALRQVFDKPENIWIKLAMGTPEYLEKIRLKAKEDPEGFAYLMKGAVGDVLTSVYRVHDKKQKFLNSGSEMPHIDQFFDVLAAYSAAGPGSSGQSDVKRYAEIVRRVEKLVKFKVTKDGPGIYATEVPQYIMLLWTVALLAHFPRYVSVTFTSGENAAVKTETNERLDLGLLLKDRWGGAAVSPESGEVNNKPELVPMGSVVSANPDEIQRLSREGFYVVDNDSKLEPSGITVTKIGGGEVDRTAGEGIVLRQDANSSWKPDEYTVEKVSSRTDAEVEGIVSPNPYLDLGGGVESLGIFSTPYDITWDTGSAELVNRIAERLQGDPELYALYTNSATLLQNSTNEEEQSEKIIWILQDLRKYIDKNRFYALPDKDMPIPGGVVPFLEWAAKNKDAGFYCQTADLMTRDFLYSLGVEVESQYGKPVEMKSDGRLYSQWGHVKTIVYLPNGRVVRVDNTPRVVEGKTPPEDIALLQMDEPDVQPTGIEQQREFAGKQAGVLDAEVLALAFLAGYVTRPKPMNLEEVRRLGENTPGRKQELLSDNELRLVSAVSLNLRRLDETDPKYREKVEAEVAGLAADADLASSWADDIDMMEVMVGTIGEGFDRYAQMKKAQQTVGFSEELNEAVRMRSGEMVKARENGVEVENLTEVPAEFCRNVFGAMSVVQAMSWEAVEKIKAHMKMNPELLKKVTGKKEKLEKILDEIWESESEKMPNEQVGRLAIVMKLVREEK